MTEQKKPKRPKFITATGTAVFPRLNTPDTKFKAEGRYSVKVRFTKEQAAPIIDKLEEAAKAEYDEQVTAFAGKVDKKGKPIEINGPDTSYEVELDDNKQPTGNILVNFGMNAQYTDKKTNEVIKLKPSLVDAKGNPTNVEVWGGSKIKVCYEIKPYFVAGTYTAGASCGLRAVQIIELVTKGSGMNGAVYGFKEEDGFTSEGADFAAAEEAKVEGVSDGTKSATSADNF